MDNLFIKLLNERRVVTFFIASIVSDNIGVNVSELFKAEENKAVTDMLSREFAAVMEQCRFRARSREALYNAAVDGDACLHYWFDSSSENMDGGEFAGTPGVIRADVIDNTNVFFGDPQRAEVEEQPYIIIQFRKFVEDVREIAETYKKGGGDAIQADEDRSAAKTEGEAPDKVTVLRKYYKKDGNVWFAEATETAVVRGPTDTGYRLYPLTWMPWEKVKNRYHGQAALTGIIPNQRFLNKLYAMAMEHVTRMAFPKVIYNRLMFPDGWTNRAGGAEGMAAFSDKLHNTQADLSVYASAFDQVDAAQAEARTSLEAAQSGMTAILRREKEERDGLTQEDIANLTEYYQQMTQANENVLNLEQEKMNQMMALYQQELAGQEYSNAAYAELAAQRLADSQAQADMVLTMLEEQYIAELAANDTWFKTLDAQQQAQNRAEYDANIAAIQTRYADEKAETQAGLADVYKMYANGYSDRLYLDTDFYKKNAVFRSQLLAEEEAYLAREAELQAKLTGDALLNAGDRAYYLTEEANNRLAYNDTMLDLWNQYNADMTDAQREQIENMIKGDIPRQL